MKTKQEQLAINIGHFKRKIKVWSKSIPNDQNPKESSGVNYHWGYHAGMVAMAKEMQEYFDYMEEQKHDD